MVPGGSTSKRKPGRKCSNSLEGSCKLLWEGKHPSQHRNLSFDDLICHPALILWPQGRLCQELLLRVAGSGRHMGRGALWRPQSTRLNIGNLDLIRKTLTLEVSLGV